MNILFLIAFAALTLTNPELLPEGIVGINFDDISLVLVVASYEKRGALTRLGGQFFPAAIREIHRDIAFIGVERPCQKFGESTAPGRVFPGYSSRSPSAFATARPCKRIRLLFCYSGTTATQDVLLNLAGRRLWKLIHKDE